MLRLQAQDLTGRISAISYRKGFLYFEPFPGLLVIKPHWACIDQRKMSKFRYPKLKGCSGGRWHTHLPERPAAAAKSLQSCLTLCDPTDGNPPSSPVPGILQARTLECVAISFFNVWKWNRSVVSDSWPHGLQPTRLFCPRDFPAKSTGVGCHCLLRKACSTQE